MSVCLSVSGKNFYMKEMYFASHTFQVSLTHKCKIILILAHVYFPPFLVSIPSWWVFPNLSQIYLAITCELLPVMCPSNNWAQICAAACIVKKNGWLYTLRCDIQFQPKPEIELSQCVYIMYVQTSGNLCHSNTNPQSSGRYVQLFSGARASYNTRLSTRVLAHAF